MSSIRINYPVGGGPYSADEDQRNPIPTLLTGWGTYSVQKLKDEIAEAKDPDINAWWKQILADHKESYEPKKGFSAALEILLKSPNIVCKLWKNGTQVGANVIATYERNCTRWFAPFPAIVIDFHTDVYKFTATLSSPSISDNLKADSQLSASPRFACPVINELTALADAKVMLATTATGTSLPLGFRHNYLDPRIGSAVAVVYQNRTVVASVFTIIKEVVKATNFGGVFEALIPIPDDSATTSDPYVLRCLLLDAKGRVLYVALTIKL